ncbi:MAG TPA: hypothetical protein VNX00_03080, partial [Herbaspirillum sp.]|nr:hypothetical protein [Herbaspirillum sp.]
MSISQESDQIPNFSIKEHGKFLLCVPIGWETYISREFYEIQEGLVAHGWTKLVIGEMEDAAIVAAI